MKIVYSVILPIYNEAERIPLLVSQYSQALETLSADWELLLVVNGSRDHSYRMACEASAQNPNVRAFEILQGGWGRAVKLGFQQARGDYLCYTNSARTDLEDLLLALRYAAVHREVVVKATRILRDSWIRTVGSSLYNFEFRTLFRVPVWDVNGTPKVLPRCTLEALAPISTLADGDLLDAQLIARCFRSRVRILEMPVLLNERYGGKSTTNLVSAWKMYRGLLGLRIRGI